MRSRFRSASERRSRTAPASTRSTSALVIFGYAIPSFLFAVLLVVLFCGGSFWQIFPLRGLTSDNFADLSWPQKIVDYLWHITLPVTSLVLGSFATSTLLTKNSFLDEIKKSYVQTARMKGLTERRVLYGHVFRNAMLIVIAGFPGAFIGAFFTGSLLIEQVFSLDGLGYLSYDLLDSARLSGGARHSLYLRSDRACGESHFRSHLHLDRSAHRFRNARGVRGGLERRRDPSRPGLTRPSTRLRSTDRQSQRRGPYDGP